MEKECNKDKYKVLFVCLGNICRSPAAQGIMEALVAERGLEEYVYVDSAGISGYHSGDLPDVRMRVHARRRGLELSHRSRRVTSDDLRNFDLVIGMDNSNVDDLREIADSVDDMSKIVQVSRYFRHSRGVDCVPDPYYEGDEGFEIVLDLLDDACGTILDMIESERKC